ncbi:hypothetical protein BUALT_Bualt06G0011800 [Buddleja alternifolia]|uniref:C2 domain-containing protein n=1 Tax=Buddleja alternifolia TaxID=168488 RepID=A0AAV6XJP3_9LAMI|nr:hypothetical protein BUALT_Bualt06G0011800 [Buddleja alternifolia]
MWLASPHVIHFYVLGHSFNLEEFFKSTVARTKIDQLAAKPTWNDKFLFRVSDEFISGDTTAVSIEIYAVGYIKDFLIGTVHFILSNTTSLQVQSASERSIRTPSYSAVQIHRSSKRFQGIVDIAAAVCCSSEFAILEKVSAVSFRELMQRKENESRLLWLST